MEHLFLSVPALAGVEVRDSDMLTSDIPTLGNATAITRASQTAHDASVPGGVTAAVTSSRAESVEQNGDHIREEARRWFREEWDADLTLGEWWQRLAESGGGFQTWTPEWYGRGLTCQLATVAGERKAAGRPDPRAGSVS